MNVVELYQKKFRKRKYFMKYAILTQIIMLVVNIAILLERSLRLMYNIKSNDFNNIIFIVLPVLFYVFFMILYYDTYKWARQDGDYSKVFVTMVNTIMVTNLVYLIVCIFDKDCNYYYLSTTIIQLVNTLFLVNYTVHDVKSFTTGIQQVILRIFIYSASISAVLALYFQILREVFVVWIFLSINSVLLIISFSIYDSYLKNRRRHV